MKRLWVVVAIAIFSTAVLAADPVKERPADPVKEKRPARMSEKSAITVKGSGTLDLKAVPGGGILASFKPENAKLDKTCSGSCDGGAHYYSWPCGNNDSCGLNCAANPPYGYCY